MTSKATVLTAEQQARIERYREELVALALAELDIPEEECTESDYDLARWAADDVIPADLFWKLEDAQIMPMLKGVWKGLHTEVTPAPRDVSAHDRYQMLKYDFEQECSSDRRAKLRRMAADGDIDALSELLGEYSE